MRFDKYDDLFAKVLERMEKRSEEAFREGCFGEGFLVLVLSGGRGLMMRV